MGPDLSFEHKYWALGYRSVGIDEVGRGCLAGPVVVAAVCLPDWLTKLRISNARDNQQLKNTPSQLEQTWWTFLNDSKKITASLRKKLSTFILKNSHVQVAWCLPREIDRWNILCASMIAMRQALWPFSRLAQVVLVDGSFSPYDARFHAKPDEFQRCGFNKIEPIVQGDSRSLSVAAASIVAKVYRDEWMETLDSYFPGYQFKAHKGYSTRAHYQAIQRLGPCEIHRMSFAPFKSDNFSP